MGLSSLHCVASAPSLVKNFHMGGLQDDLRCVGASTYAYEYDNICTYAVFLHIGRRNNDHICVTAMQFQNQNQTSLNLVLVP